MSLPHPETWLFKAVDHLLEPSGKIIEAELPKYPFVFKYPWGGEGGSVLLIPSEKDFRQKLRQAPEQEKWGRNGFLLQEHIPAHRVLRMVRIGGTLYFHRPTTSAGTSFAINLARVAGTEIKQWLYRLWLSFNRHRHEKTG